MGVYPGLLISVWLINGFLESQGDPKIAKGVWLWLHGYDHRLDFFFFTTLSKNDPEWQLVV